MKKITVTTSLCLLALALSIAPSCKKDNDTNPTPPSSYTLGSIIGVSINSIPNPSIYYEPNGADLYWTFYINSDTSSIALIDEHNYPKIDVHDNQFPVVWTYLSGFPVLRASGYTANSSAQPTNGNFFLKVYDEDIINNGQSTNQFVGEINFTWNELVTHNAQHTLTKSLNGISVKITYTLQ